jgi:hypothetical protein
MVQRVTCSCGHEQDAAAMPKRGWQSDGAGGGLFLANCTVCGSTLVIEERSDASICSVCHRLVTGADGDTKVWSEEDDGDGRVLCTGCARREGIGYAPGLLPRRYPAGRLAQTAVGAP